MPLLATLRETQWSPLRGCSWTPGSAARKRLAAFGPRASCGAARCCSAQPIRPLFAVRWWPANPLLNPLLAEVETLSVASVPTGCPSILPTAIRPHAFRCSVEKLAGGLPPPGRTTPRASDRASAADACDSCRVCDVDISANPDPTRRSVSELYIDFGIRLRVARKKARLSQAALGSLVGLSRTSITNIEAGRQQLTLHAFMAMAKAVGLPASSLLPDADQIRMAPQLDLAQNELRWFQRVISDAKETSTQHAKT